MHIEAQILGFQYSILNPLLLYMDNYHRRNVGLIKMYLFWSIFGQLMWEFMEKQYEWRIWKQWPIFPQKIQPSFWSRKLSFRVPKQFHCYVFFIFYVVKFCAMMPQRYYITVHKKRKLVYYLMYCYVVTFGALWHYIKNKDT